MSVWKHHTVVPVLLIVTATGLAVARQDEVAALRAKARSALSQTEGEHRVAGLDQPVEIVRDRWGVPHVYAKTVADLFFAQGYVAAQDRLWQLDLWRRIAEGKLSEILGPAGVTRDTFARLLRYRGDMNAEWQAYGPGAKQIIEAFVGGINAHVDEVLADSAALPVEFQLTGSRPEKWTREVVIGRMAGFIMTRNARTEVQRAKLTRSVGAARVAEFMPTDPPARIGVPEGLDLGDITDDILELTAGSGETVNFNSLRKEQVARPGPGSFGFVRPSPSTSPVETAEGRDTADEAVVGSNDWVVSGRLTASGKPLLANDPHRTLMLPSLRYTVHLNGPGWNVIGAGEPALPGVAAGHNDRIAFGFTIVGIDQQDLYVEHLDPENPDRYRYRGAWERVRVERERLVVRGEQPREIELRFTRHGPVLHVDAKRHRAYALRWVGAEPGSAGYLRSLVIDTARNWREFLSALDGWKVPSENLVYADVDGNIGWMAAGLAPVRPNWDGLLPVPGQDGKYEWNGFLRASELPRLLNPRNGLIVTANHNILPRRYGKALGYEFSSPYRFARILEVLDRGRREGRKFAAADFERLQHDETSVVARVVCGALRQALAERSSARTTPLSAIAGQAARTLTRWNGVLGRDSAAAALYEIWLPRLAAAFRDAMIPPADRVHVGDRVSVERLLGLLTAAGLAPVEHQPGFAAWVDGSPRALWAAVAARQRLAPAGRRLAIDALTGPALEEAWREAAERMGPDPARWAWGRIHRACFEHPLAFTSERREVMSLADVPRGGDGTTPNATGNGPRQTSGASYREVLDLSDWDRSVTINVPGLSGQPRSPHYGDLLPLWADGRYHPLVFSREAVEKYAAERLRLVPAPRPANTQR
jgi:penicillin amidase